MIHANKKKHRNANNENTGQTCADELSVPINYRYIVLHIESPMAGTVLGVNRAQAGSTVIAAI